MIKKPLRPALRTALSKAIGIINEQIKVTALSLNGVNAYLSHQLLSAPGAFKVRIVTQLASAGGYLLASSADGSSRLAYFNGNGYVQVAGGSITAENDLTAEMAGNQIHELIAERDAANKLTLTLNGVEIQNGIRGGSFNVDLIGKPWGSGTSIPYHDGQVFLIDYESGFQDTAGNPLNPIFYPGKRPELPYVPNERAVLGAELIPGADISAFVATNDASKSGDSFTNTEQYRGIYYDVPGLVVGQSYAVKIECDYIDSGSTEAYLYVSNSFGTIAESVVLQSGTTKWIVFTAIAVTQRLYLRRSALGTANISLVSLRSAPGYALKNGTAPDGSDHESYTKMADGRLSGKELSTLGELSLSQGQQSSVLDLGELIEVEIKKAAGVEVTASGSWVGSGSESITVTTRYISFRNTTATTEVFTPSVRAVLSYAPGANT